MKLSKAVGIGMVFLSGATTALNTELLILEWGFGSCLRLVAGLLFLGVGTSVIYKK